MSQEDRVTRSPTLEGEVSGSSEQEEFLNVLFFSTFLGHGFISQY